MECPECGELLEDGEVDSRQEWTRITYYCDTCEEDYTRLITYQTQSSMVASDEWEHETSESDLKIDDDAIKEKFQKLADIAHNAISHVGKCNGNEREREAHNAITNFMDNLFEKEVT